MSITRGVAAAAVFAGVAVAAASTAWADPPTLSGAYTATDPSGTYPLQFTPCGPGCSHVQDPSDASFSGTAHLYNGQWIVDILNWSTAITCSDGSKHPGDYHIVWDANTLQGAAWSTTANNPCPGGPPGPLSNSPIPFSMKKAS
jgi:hypothetical protein